MRFSDKKVIVTGSAGAIGGAIAGAFAREGARLGLIDLKCTSLFEDSSNRHVEAIADLADLPSLKSAITTAASHLGGVDILVNAVGVTSFGGAAELSEDEWDRVLSINLKSVFFACQAVMPYLKAAGGGGRIINIGSLLGKNGGNARPWIDPAEQTASGNVAYGVSKAGVHAITIYLAKELAAAGVTVNAVAPGPIVSAMTSKFPDRLRALLPVARMGQPMEVSAAVLFLASTEAAFITGEVLDVNGGAWCD